MRGLARVAAGVSEVNGQLARHETIKDFAVLPGEFSVETGELTTTFKLRRRAVFEKYSSVLEAFYSGTVRDL